MMERDFTIAVYSDLLQAALDAGFVPVTMEAFASAAATPKKIIILRHDVDKRPGHSLETARLQHSKGVKGTYYFRITSDSFDPVIIKKIAGMGHEIGYHYEDVAIANGDLEAAYQLFNRHLAKLREYYPVKTVCMHGSPLSKWDNKLLWKKYNYRELGIIAEPYFDIDFDKVLYLTDTGRSWNSGGAIVRDKVETAYRFELNNTFDLIRHFNEGWFPPQIMLNIHPQRWTSTMMGWTEELLFQNAKNFVKRIINKSNRMAF